MKRLRLASIILVAGLTLGGCATWDKIKEVAAVATTTIVNPIDSTDIYRARNVYEATLKVVDGWRTYCWERSYQALMSDPVARPICQNRHARLTRVQVVLPKARAALLRAEKFIRENPTLSAVTVIRQAWDAVRELQQSSPIPVSAT